MLSLSLQYWKHSNACHYNHQNILRVNTTNV